MRRFSPQRQPFQELGQVNNRLKNRHRSSAIRMSTPRKRVSTVYKRYIKNQTGVDTVPTSSKKTFMEHYNQIVQIPLIHGVEASSSVEDVYLSRDVQGQITVDDEAITCNAIPTPDDVENDAEILSQIEMENDCETNDDVQINSEDSYPENTGRHINEDELSGDEDDTASEWNIHDNVYEGSQITLATSILLIITFCSKYSLTAEGITELLQLLNLHCLSLNILPKTLYAFKKFFGNVKYPLVSHKYCSFCLLPVKSSNEFCPNNLCKRNLTCEGAVSGFIEIPIHYQLQSLLQRPGYSEKLKHKNTRIKKSKNAIEDIFDGALYKNLVSEGVLNNDYDLSLIFNTDGAKPFRSSKTSLWPIYFMINELPFGERRLPENMILAGIWYGCKKPEMTGFLSPFMKTLNQLEEGISLTIGKSVSKIRAIVIASTCDLPARACVCSMNQYNGESSCVKCTQSGKVVKVGRGHTRVFTPDMENINGPKRTDKSVLQNAQEAVRLKKPVQGIKGPSWFSFLTYYSFTSGTGIDYMHGILLGVTKMLTSLWFSVKYSKEEFSISHRTDTVNKRLAQIKPPNYMSRLPRSLSDSEYWKASEWKFWLLFYAPAILHGLMDPHYYEHFLLLSEAIHILLRDSILPKEIQHSKMMLIRFVAMFPVLYRESSMTLNVHQLLHYPDEVLNLGPLWCFSCFPFEDANGFLLQLFNGTQHIDKQIADAICTLQKVPELITLIEKDSEAYHLYCKMKNKMSKSKCSFLEKNIYLVGASHFEKKLSSKFLKSIESLLGVDIGKIISFKRVKIRGDIFFSRMYTRVNLRNSYTVSYSDFSGEICYGFIEMFVQVLPACNCIDNCLCDSLPMNLCLIKKLNVNGYHFESSYIRLVESTAPEEIIAVPLSSLKRKCVYICFDDSPSAYVLNVPNVLEKD